MENNEYGFNKVEKKVVSKVVAKKLKLAEAKKKTEEKRKIELAKEKELEAELEIEIDKEIVKIVRSAVSKSKFLGDINAQVKELF